MDYNNGKIYKITNDFNDMVYIGSTTQSLSKRFSTHKKDMMAKLHLPLYSLMKNIGYERFCISLIVECPCSNKTELLLNEGKYIRGVPQEKRLNKKIEGRTKKEYNEDNAEKNKERNKKYNIENADKHREYNKEYYEVNKVLLKERTKKYYEDNKEEINRKHREYSKEYYQRKKLEKLKKENVAI